MAINSSRDNRIGSHDPLYDKVTGAYLGLAVGDALGATVEFMTAREIRTSLGRHDTMRGGGWLHLKRGQVTDDTTMALALGASILQQGRVDAHSVAEAFSNWLREKPVDIGNTVRRGIVHYRYSGNPEAPESEFDAGNGAAMRCLPIALCMVGQTSDRIKASARVQAHVTHNNAVSDAACECIIAMVQSALAGDDKARILNGPVSSLLRIYPQYEFHKKRCETPSAYIVETLQAVFQAFFDTDSFSDCLVDVVNRGGDADTTGAIAGMIAGSYYGISSIPRDWLQALDRDIYSACEAQALGLYRLCG